MGAAWGKSWGDPSGGGSSGTPVSPLSLPALGSPTKGATGFADDGIMKHSPAQILAELLIVANQGTRPVFKQPWSVSATQEPNAPDNCIVVYDTAPRSDGRSMFGTVWEHPGLSFTVRATDHDTGWVKSKALHKYLTEKVYRVKVVLDGILYMVHSVSKCSGPLSIGKEHGGVSKRRVYTINAAVTISVVKKG